jgi:hypothetical protein
MLDTNSVAAIYQTHTQAEEAVKELQKSGFDMKKLSIVGKGYHTDEHVVGYYNTGNRMEYWGKLGAAERVRRSATGTHTGKGAMMPASQIGTLETILVVDDNAELLEVVTAILKAEHFQVLSGEWGCCA